VSEIPQIAVIRGGRQRVVASRTPAAEKSKENSRLAALPPSSLSAPTVSDAPPITLRRGVQRARHALVGRINPAQPVMHLLTVIRGARPHPRVVRLEAITQPGPLILRIPD